MKTLVEGMMLTFRAVIVLVGIACIGLFLAADADLKRISWGVMATAFFVLADVLKMDE